MEPYEPKLILVPTDFSEPAAHALRYASALAGRSGAHLLIIHADLFAPFVDITAVPAGVDESSRQAMIEAAREALQTHAEENVAANVPFDLRVIVGGPLEAIAAEIRESGANLVIMGTHGRTGMSRLLFGSVTESLMRTCTIPVLAVTRGAPESAHVEKVLCPVSFTETGREAVRRAAVLVDGTRARLVLVRSTTDDPLRVERWIPRELVDRCEIERTSAGDAEEIVSLATTSGADLIALGVEPDRTVHEMLRGTFAERIVQQSRCAVLAVNAHAVGVTSESESLATTPVY
jgi:nucleotide-binding universal stress UspA family protein